MGWNSFDCYGSSVTEAQFRANVDFLAERLKPHGWEYCVVDFCWSHPDPGPVANPNQADGFLPALCHDEYGRLLPAPNRFPSAAAGNGFKPLADYVHGKGLKFGIHIMRGIPRQVVEADLPVSGTSLRASAIADTASTCGWLNHMYGIDHSRPGAQAYYDALFALYASWDIDFIKADDILTGYPGPYHQAEIEALRTAIDRCGRPMVLSLSPGPAPLHRAEHLAAHANLWRISMDFWDTWWKLKDQFHLCNAWSNCIRPGGWPDADMLPLGHLALCGPEGPDRQSTLTPDEARTMITLWCIFRSPLMFGGNLPTTDARTISLLTNDQVLYVNQHSVNNHQLSRNQDRVAWLADDPATGDRFLALFNLSDAAADVPVQIRQLGFGDRTLLFADLWTGETVPADARFQPGFPAHGSSIYRVRPVG